MRSTAIFSLIVLLFSASAPAANKIYFNAAGNMVINGTAMFPLSLAYSPPPDSKTPAGKDAFTEVHDAGVICFRVPPPLQWDDEDEAGITRYLDAAASHHMYAWISLRGIDKLSKPGTAEEKTLRRVIAKFKDHPATMGWKGKDEPAWGNVPPEDVIRAYKVIKEVDNNNLPVNVGQAPRNTWQDLARYAPGLDYTCEDIFPIGYPPGKHSNLPNKGISVVGDETQKIMKAAQGKPVWMTLQIAWSGVSNPEKNTLRFPTFPEERYMTYEAIINGARGLNYFGGMIEKVMTPEDQKLGWNWHFWNRVLRPVLEEINPQSPLYPALLVANSNLPIKVEDAPDVEFCAREVGHDLFILASKREGATVHIKFTGLPPDVAQGDVLYESPRTVQANDGSFPDWFAPNEVHVYRFHRH